MPPAVALTPLALLVAAADAARLRRNTMPLVGPRLYFRNSRQLLNAKPESLRRCRAPPAHMLKCCAAFALDSAAGPDADDSQVTYHAALPPSKWPPSRIRRF